MLFNPTVNGLGATADNFGATITDSGIGSNVIANGSANTKGTATICITALNNQKASYGIGILLTGGNTSAAIRRYLVDILWDAGPTPSTVRIPNLYANSPSLIAGGYRYYFPIYIPAGFPIAARCQCSTGGSAIKVSIQLYGEPSRPDLYRVGSYVEAFGVDTATTSGTAITPGNGAVGAYTQIGTTTEDLWWWQWGGIGTNDTTMGAFSQQGDVACGDATFKKTCVDNCIQVNTAAEQSGKDAFGMKMPYRHIPGGTNVYVRSSGSGAADTTPTTTAYGLGG